MRRKIVISASVILIVALSATIGFVIGDHMKSGIGYRSLKKNDSAYQAVIAEIKKSNPDFIRVTGGNIGMIPIYGKSENCVLAYANRPIPYSDSDFIYCFSSGWSGNLRRI